MGEEWKHASLASNIGKWAWIIGIVNGLIGIFWGIYGVSVSLIGWSWLVPVVSWYDVWTIIWGIVLIAISFLVIKPKFSAKCAEMDWDALYGWILNLGNFRLPWMLFWGIFFEIFGWYGWGGLAILIPALLLLFAGPKEFQWSTETKPVKKEPAKKKPVKAKPAEEQI